MKAYDKFRVNSVSPTHDCYARVWSSRLADLITLEFTDSNRGYHLSVRMSRDEASDLANTLTAILRDVPEAAKELGR